MTAAEIILGKPKAQDAPASLEDQRKALAEITQAVATLAVLIEAKTVEIENTYREQMDELVVFKRRLAGLKERYKLILAGVQEARRKEEREKQERRARGVPLGDSGARLYALEDYS